MLNSQIKIYRDNQRIILKQSISKNILFTYGLKRMNFNGNYFCSTSGTGEANIPRKTFFMEQNSTALIF